MSTTNLTALPAGTQKRQTCSVCLRTTTDYTTEVIDRRTSHEVKAGRPERLGRFHTCRVCASRNILHVRITDETGTLLADVDAISTADGLAYFLQSRHIDDTATAADIADASGAGTTQPVVFTRTEWDGRISEQYLAEVGP